MKCIKVLCVEDRPADAELIELHLKRSDMQVVFHLVDSRDAYVEALENFVPDVITCDHALPSFNSFDALKLLQQTSLSVPFIVISGTLTEDQAIELVREGADDFLLKDNLRRLPLTVVNLVEKYSFENERSLLLKKVVAKEISSKRKLCRLNEKLLLATKAAGLSIWEYHIEKNELKYDSSFPAVIGIAEKDCGNTLESWVRLVHPDDRPLMYNAMHQCIHYAKGIHVEYRVIVSDGTVKFVRVTGVLQCLLAGKGHKLVGTIQDITAAKQKQHELAYSEERYRSICENSIDAIFLSSTNGTILAANAAAQKMFGMPEEEIRQAGRAKLVVHDDSFIRLINERNKKGCAQGVINPGHNNRKGYIRAGAAGKCRRKGTAALYRLVQRGARLCGCFKRPGSRI
jgi:PAS domain-containing protein